MFEILKFHFFSFFCSKKVDSFFDIFFDANVCGDECPKPPAQPDDVYLLYLLMLVRNPY